MLKDRVGLVTGGASGIGRAAVQAMAAAGAKVVVADVDEEGGAAAVRDVREAGGVAEFLRTDVSDTADVDAMVALALSAFGGLDAAFNNAGVEGDQALLQNQDMARVQRVFALHHRQACGFRNDKIGSTRSRRPGHPHQCCGAGADPHAALAARLEQRSLRGVGEGADAPHRPARGSRQCRSMAAFGTG